MHQLDWQLDQTKKRLQSQHCEQQKSQSLPMICWMMRQKIRKTAVLHPVSHSCPLLLLHCAPTSYLYLRLSFGDPVDQAVVSMLDLLPEEDLFKLLSGKAYVRQRPGKFLPEETSILHQNAGRLEEQRRKKEAVPSMIVTAEEYEAYGITFMAEFPTGPLDWADNPNKITLVDSMPQIGSSFKNALDTSAIAPAELETVRLAVEQEVAALYQGNAESEVERASKLYGRSGLYLIREMACKLK